MGVSGLLLLFPFLLLRFGLLGRLGRDGLGRAAHIPPMGGRERLAYWVYQLSSAGVLVCLCAQRAEVDGAWPFWAGLVLYLLGLALCAGLFLGMVTVQMLGLAEPGLCAGAVVSFGRPSPGPFREDGLYRFSRNPMYVSYFVYFAGCVLLTRSRLLAALVLLFQLSEHWIILAEERWCREQFGAPYEAYRKRVRRYL